MSKKEVKSHTKAEFEAKGMDKKFSYEDYLAKVKSMKKLTEEEFKEKGARGQKGAGKKF